MSIHPCIECDDEVRPRQQALQCDDYGRSYGLSDLMIDFCVVKVFMAFIETKKKFLKLKKCPWVRNEYIYSSLRLLIVYRPPYSTEHKDTVSVFLGDFLITSNRLCFQRNRF